MWAGSHGIDESDPLLTIGVLVVTMVQTNWRVDIKLSSIYTHSSLTLTKIPLLEGSEVSDRDTEAY